MRKLDINEKEKEKEIKELRQRVEDLESETKIDKRNTYLVGNLNSYMVKRGIIKRGQCSVTEIVRLYEKLKSQQSLPNEHGTNRYGLDVAYFRNAINRELNRPLNDFKPDELARVLARLSKTADSEVMFEPEFSEKHDAEVAARAVEEAIVSCGEAGKALRIPDGYYLSETFLFSYAKQLRKQGHE